MNERAILVPDAELLALDRLVGIWRITGGVEGTTTFRWMEGGFFLIQEGEIVHDGDEIRILEVIGREKPVGALEAHSAITAHGYTDTGDTLDHVYRMDGNILTIGDRNGSPVSWRFSFGPDDKTITGDRDGPQACRLRAARID